MEKITPADIRYPDLASKRFNKRFSGKPDHIYLPSSVDDVLEAVQDAVDNKLRLVVRSGGHCLEGFVSDPAVQVIMDMCLMTNIYYDATKSAIAVEAGATVGEMYRRLFLKWGLFLPAGEYPGIGMGGHIPGGAFGFFCREYGLAADHLYGIELVTVDTSGKANCITATREVNDPNRELWWAHTGGGAGNFGVVTKFWFRSPEAVGADPASVLPKAPASVTTFRLGWDWKQFDEKSFSSLVKNFGNWCQQNSDVNSPFAKLFSLLFLNHRQLGRIEIKGVCTGPNAKVLINQHLADIATPLDLEHSIKIDECSWLQFALNPFPELFQPGFENVKAKAKDAFLRQAFSDDQIATAWKFLTTETFIGGMLGMATYGGKVNTIAPDATASFQRNCILDIACNAGWVDAAGEAATLPWVRGFYQELFAASGGVPAPNEKNGGCMINHPDTDLADPELNKSGVPWHTLYYQDNYPRLQNVKMKWDPLNIFHHALSIEAKK
ncbi:FAD-dependent oxidoreductase [Pseudobacter ginsenosidimutans]|uniref:Aclacinomycin oxidase n=1 Tax=Pseudobacter ginsenosidimutans TaxID=661488 RepID=A0A4Q7N5J9_9BACT|nr:FAD-binding oxidoreductase [Pseudobacter ginsenosidimutans]QEC44828.1 FAD-binding oxidoreductase [Pseudobacter ginsenosidimutans]RZS76318.1 aclacinomycin oxidase [Pseudobacter ginsenosidimutans]